MSILTRFVAASTDDAYESEGNTGYNDSGNVVQLWGHPTNPALRFVGGFRFLNVTIPQGEQINSARLFLAPDAVLRDDMNMRVACHKVANSPTFSISDSPNDRTGARTSEPITNWILLSATGSVDGDGYNVSPNFGPAVQEVINLGGWSSGNALSVILVSRSTIRDRYDAESFDKSSLIPKIIINHGVAASEDDDALFFSAVA